MARICEVCGKIEEPEDEDNKYDFLDICMECEQALYTHSHTIINND